VAHRRPPAAGLLWVCRAVRGHDRAGELWPQRPGLARIDTV